MLNVNSKNKLVSIAIATYNCEVYIEKCLQSVIDQTYKNLDILIIDDGSNDNTMQICKRFLKDKRVIYIQKENGGLSSARQLGLDSARGDYICFIDADDTLSEEYVAVMYNHIVKKSADICICGVNFIDSQGIIRAKKPKLKGRDLFFDINRLEKEYVKIAGISEASDSWNKMYRKEFLKKSGVSFHMIKGLNGTDKLFNNELLFYCPRIVSVNNCLYNHISRPVSMINRKNKKLFLMNEYIIHSLYKLSFDMRMNMISSQLIKQYYYGLQRAVQDIYDTKNTTRDLLKNLEECCISNRNFRERHKGFMYAKSNSYMVILMKFLCEHVNLLCFYLEIKKRLAKLYF